MHTLTNKALIDCVLGNPQASEAELEMISRLQAAIEEIDLLSAELRQRNAEALRGANTRGTGQAPSQEILD